MAARGLLTLALAGLCAAGAQGAGKHVVSLLDDTFDAHVASHKYVLAEFYAPWCGHCKSLAPEYEKAAEHFAGVQIEGGLSLVAVDATVAKDLATKYEVQGFPTLKWIVNGEASEYQGGRTKDEIVSWVTKKTGPPAKTIADAAALAAFKEGADVTVFGYFGAVGSPAQAAFIAAAESSDAASFGFSTTVSGGLQVDQVAVFRKFEGEEPTVVCAGEVTKASVKNCLAANQLPLLVPFSQQTAPKIFGGEIKQHVLVFLDNKADDKDALLGSVRPVAMENKGKYLFVTVDKTDDRILEFFGITAEQLPTARIVEMLDSGMKKFAMDGAFSEDALNKMVASHTAGELKQALKSEADIPDEEQPKDGHVWVLTGKNHDRVAFGGKNVLVEYYAPWCGHCKKLAPEFEKLAESYKGEADIIIAKMDSTANEVEAVQVSGFPTLKFFPAGAKSADDMVDFNGDRDEKGMKAFIEKSRK